MVDHCEIGVLTLRNLGLELYLYLILLFVLIVCHCFYNLKVWVKYFNKQCKDSKKCINGKEKCRIFHVYDKIVTRMGQDRDTDEAGS